MCGILKELPEPESPKKTVYVMHMPPAGLRLGQLLYQDLDIGSVDIYEFLKPNSRYFLCTGIFTKVLIQKKDHG